MIAFSDNPFEFLESKTLFEEPSSQFSLFPRNTTLQIEDLVIYRFFANDTFAREVKGTNSATLGGDANFACGNLAANKFFGQINAKVATQQFGIYQRCNHGFCECRGEKKKKKQKKKKKKKKIDIFNYNSQDFYFFKKITDISEVFF